MQQSLRARNSSPHRLHAMKPRHKRAAIICRWPGRHLAGCFLVLNAFESNLVFFFSPSQVVAGEVPKNHHLPRGRHGQGGFD